MSSVSVNLRLRTIEDFFRPPEIDPTADWFRKHSLASSVDYVVDKVGDRPGIASVSVTIHLPAETIAEGLEQRVEAGVVKCCDARLHAVEQATAEDRSRRWLMLAFSVFAVFVLVWVAQQLSDSGQSLLGVASEGLSIAAWVMLWHPLEKVVFNRWDHRLDRRALHTVRGRSSMRIEPLESGVEAQSCAAERQAPDRVAGPLGIAAVRRRVLLCGEPRTLGR